MTEALILRGARQGVILRGRTAGRILRAERSGVLLRGPRGAPGVPAKVFLELLIQGSFTARMAILPAPLRLTGSGVLTGAASRARSFKPCSALTVWSATLDGTFASEDGATDGEIAAALFATFTFPAGPGDAVVAYPNGGAFADGQVLRLWQSATPDLGQDRTSIILAGA